MISKLFRKCLPHKMRQQKKTRVALIEYYLFNAKYGGWYKVQGQQLADCWVLHWPLDCQPKCWEILGISEFQMASTILQSILHKLIID